MNAQFFNKKKSEIKVFNKFLFSKCILHVNRSNAQKLLELEKCFIAT